MERESARRTRQLKPAERGWVIEKVGQRDFRRELWRRSRPWRRIVLSGALAALGFVQFGADLGEALRRLLEAFGHA